MTGHTTPAIGTRYPLLFTYRDTLFGNGFLVEVQATNGRALCVREDDEYWVYGVNPGGMAGHTARTLMRRTWHSKRHSPTF